MDGVDIDTMQAAGAVELGTSELPVRNLPLPQQVREIVLRRIIGGQYGPGERLVETRIARELKVSQGSVREALRQLETGGLVEYVPQRGVVVREVSDSEFAEVALVRAVLEATAAELAAHRRISTAPLREQIRYMDQYAKRADLRSWVIAAVQFHRLIVQGSGNGVLLTAWEGLNIEVRTIQVARDPLVSMAGQDSAHRAIVDALERGDSALAGSLSRSHEEAFTPPTPVSPTRPATDPVEPAPS